MAQRITMELAPVLSVLRKYGTDAEACAVGLDTLQYLVAIGDVEDEMEEEDLLPIVIAALQANPDSAKVAVAGHAVLSCTALRSADPNLAVAQADTGAVARFYAWAEERKRQRENVKRIMGRFRNQAAAAAFATWAETTQQMVGIKRLVASLLHRELAAALQQWVKGVASHRGARRSTRLQEADALLAAGECRRALDCTDEALHLGQGLLGLAGDEEAAARAPIAAEGAEDAMEEVGGGGVDPAAVAAAATDLRDRAAAAVEELAESEKAARIESMLRRWRNSQLLVGWDGWMAFRHRVELCQRIGSRISLRGQHMAFDGWLNGAYQQVAMRELMVRVAQTISNTAIMKCLNRWKRFL